MDYKKQLKDPRWQKRPGIYKIIINNKIYIGSAVNLKKRLTQHLGDLKRRKHVNIHMQRSFDKYKKIDFEIIEIVNNHNMLIEREQFYIDLLLPELNIAKIAGSQLGFRHSEKTKRKISEMQKGKIITEEARKRMSESKIGCFIGTAIVGEIKKPKKTSRSKQRYQRYLEFGDWFETFLEFCYWDAKPDRSWNPSR